MFYLGLMFRDRDPIQSMEWYRKAADGGDKNAAHNIGVALSATDSPEAIPWFERAAEAGHVGAMRYLGEWLFPTDQEVGRRWLERAAEAGDAQATMDLASWLSSADPDAARRWVERLIEMVTEEELGDLMVANLRRTLERRQGAFIDERLNDPEEYKAAFVNALRQTATVIDTPTHITVTFERPDDPGVRRSLELLTQELNHPGHRLPGDSGTVTYEIAESPESSR
jgi:hypothetical protein